MHIQNLNKIPINTIAKAVSLFLEGKDRIDVKNITGLGIHDLETIVKELNNSNSYFYDSAAYQKIQKIRIEKSKKIHNLIIEHKLPVASVFENKSNNLLKEIILVALTYRVSLKSLAILFNTSIEDIKQTFLFFDFDYLESLNFLHIETQNETKEEEKIAYEKAEIYFYLRSKLILAIKGTNHLETKENYKHLRMNLLKEIDDSFIKRIAGRKISAITIQDREYIARYRLKYYFSMAECSEKLKRSSEFIRACEEELALKDEIYAKKLAVLNETFYLPNRDSEINNRITCKRM